MAARARRSTVEIGTAFERLAQAYCNHTLHMSLRRVGRAGDGGVDLRGHWWVPGDCRSNKAAKAVGESSRRLRVLAQCKAEAKPLGPRVVRELEGVIGRASLLNSDSAEDKDSTVGLIISQAGFSKAAMKHASSSKAPLCFIHLPGSGLEKVEDEGNDFTANSNNVYAKSVWWNDALGGTRGVLGGRIQLSTQILPEIFGIMDGNSNVMALH